MTGEQSHISSSCRRAMTEHGVLTRTLDDNTVVPAAMDLMNQETIKVLIVRPDENGHLPPEMVTEQFRNFMQYNGMTELLDGNASPLEESETPSTELQNTISQGIKEYYDGNVEFTQSYEEADVVVFGYDLPDSVGYSGVGSYPIHDNSADQGYYLDKSFIGINRPIENGINPITIAHEFGHNLGFVHPFETILHATPNGDYSQCSVDEFVALTDTNNDGIMNYGGVQRDWFDDNAETYVRTGELPPAANTIKP